MDDKYEAMLFGIAIFVCGIIVAIILSKVFKQESVVTRAQVYPVFEQITSPIVSLKPATEIPPAGELMDKRVLVTNEITELYKTTDGFPWTSFDMDNNGPNPVYFCVNQWVSPEAPIGVGQSIHIDLKNRGAIHKVYLKCDKGKTTNVSFYIIR